jgi:argininosuccinate lyase
MKLWAGRFSKDLNKAVMAFTTSIDVDKKLALYDILGSMAHAKMLAKCKIIKNKERDIIIKGLDFIRKEIEKKDKLPLEEDIHMYIEKRLIKKIGSVGAKLHTARSRNDQIVLDERLYLREEIKEIVYEISSLQKVFVAAAEKNVDVVMPGFTHMQHAQPVLMGYHLLTYFYMLERDKQRLKEIFKRVNVMPLGSGALAGTSLPIDRNYVAKLLEFPEVTPHALDTISDRDYMLEVVSACSMIMMHLSRWAEEVIVWSTSEFNFIKIDDSFCTGSSMMPNKKNPDIAELIKGKTGGVYGDLINLLVTMKALPLGYNRDMQEDKKAVFNTLDITKASLVISQALLKHIKFNKKRLLACAEDGYILATDIAEYLVKRGVPFRDAHKIVGGIVKYSLDNKKKLQELSLSEFKKFYPKADKNMIKILDLKNSVISRKSYGGTSPGNVKKMIKKIKAKL